MCVVRAIADTHFGHNKIIEYGNRPGTTTDEHDEWIIEQWNSVVNKRDLTWVLGDVAFTKHHIALFKRCNGTKHLIWGNHDKHPISFYNAVFNRAHGFQKYKEFWLSHPPIHPGSLRNRFNVHGHTHGSMDDKRYICVSVECLNGVPIKFDDLRKIAKRRHADDADYKPFPTLWKELQCCE